MIDIPEGDETGLGAPPADPADPMAAAPAGPRQRMRIPKSALAINGDSPSDGDPVEFSVTGRVVGSSGDFLELELDTANGEDAPGDDEGLEPGGDEMDMEALQSAAASSMGVPNGGPY